MALNEAVIQEVVSQVRGRRVWLTDLDCVHINLFLPSIEYWNKVIPGLNIQLEQLTEYDVQNVLHRDHPDRFPTIDAAVSLLCDTFTRSEVVRSAPPFPNMVENAKRWKRQDGAVTIVTTNRFDYERNDPGGTEDWLERHGVPYDRLLFVDGRERTELAAAIAACVAPDSIMVDDRADTIRAIISRLPPNSNLQPFLLKEPDRPWTLNPADNDLPYVTEKSLARLINCEP